ncbi:type II secretion system protein [bacterium]|nr:MAG: type II secretion system protein [bacterium]
MKKNAFTLIELLVVIAIVGFLTTSVIFGATRSKRVNSLNRAAKEVLLALRDAQNQSLITQKGNNGVVPCGYGIHHDSADEKGFIIFKEETSPPGEECIATSTPDQNIDRLWGGFGSESTLETFIITENNYVKIENDFDDIYFEPPDGLTYFDGEHDNTIAPTAEIILCLRSDCINYRKSIKVYLGGNIEIE